MSSISLDCDACRESPWFMALTDGQRWAFLSFVGYSYPKPRGFVKKMPLELLARRIEADLENVRSMLESAMKWIDPETGKPDPKIVDWGKKWEVMDYDKFNPPRQEDRDRKSERNRRDYDRRKSAQSAHFSAVSTPPSSSPSPSASASLGIKDALSDGDIGRTAKEACDLWNQMVSDLKAQNLNCRLKPVHYLTPKRLKHLEARLAQEGFDMAALCGKIRGSPYLRGEKGNWVVTFDWVVGSPNNWLKIAEGRYDDAPEPVAGSHREHGSEGVYLDAR
jgi:hypothetical protein